MTVTGKYVLGLGDCGYVSDMEWFSQELCTRIQIH